MTLEMENKIVSELRKIEVEKRQLIREIAKPDVSAKDNADALAKMRKLSRRKRLLTRPSVSVAA